MNITVLQSYTCMTIGYYINLITKLGVCDLLYYIPWGFLYDKTIGVFFGMFWKFYKLKKKCMCVSTANWKSKIIFQ